MSKKPSKTKTPARPRKSKAEQAKPKSNTPLNSGLRIYELRDGVKVEILPDDPRYLESKTRYVFGPSQFDPNPATWSPELRKQAAELDAKSTGKFGHSPAPVILPPQPRRELASTAAKADGHAADAGIVSQLDVAKELSERTGRPLESCKTTVSSAVKRGDLESTGKRKECRIEKPKKDAWLKRHTKKSGDGDDIDGDLEIV